MSNTAVRKKLYTLNNNSRMIRSNLMKTLEQAESADEEAISAALEDSRRELAKLKQEHREASVQATTAHKAESARNIGYTEIFQDAVAQAHKLRSHACGGVKFHIYN